MVPAAPQNRDGGQFGHERRLRRPLALLLRRQGDHRVPAHAPAGARHQDARSDAAGRRAARNAGRQVVEKKSDLMSQNAIKIISHIRISIQPALHSTDPLAKLWMRMYQKLSAEPF